MSRTTGLGLVALAAGVFLAAGCSSPGLYKADAGPWPVEVADGVRLTDPLQQRGIDFRVLHPQGSGAHPVVVFSHGGFCAPEMYDRITGHWVSHGYIVIEPEHLDAPDSVRQAGPPDMARLLPSRLRDVSYAVDVLPEIGRLAGITGGLANPPLAIAGHSFGGAVAATKAGLILKPDAYRGTPGGPQDPRFRAAILLSPPGSGEDLAENAFDGLRLPLMTTGGTADVGRGYDGSLPPGEWRRRMYQLAPPGDKYSVIIEDADHYLGGLICNPERGGEPDPGGVEIVRAMTTAFLDAYLKDDPAAQAFLANADVAKLTGGRADYQRR
jgi:predicted dienelactone hydrolase